MGASKLENNTTSFGNRSVVTCWETDCQQKLSECSLPGGPRPPLKHSVSLSNTYQLARGACWIAGRRSGVQTGVPRHTARGPRPAKQWSLKCAFPAVRPGPCGPVRNRSDANVRHGPHRLECLPSPYSKAIAKPVVREEKQLAEGMLVHALCAVGNHVRRAE